MGYVCGKASSGLCVARLEREMIQLISVPSCLHLLERELDPDSEDLSGLIYFLIFLYITSSMASGKICNFSELRVLINKIGLLIVPILLNKLLYNVFGIVSGMS